MIFNAFEVPEDSASRVAVAREILPVEAALIGTHRLILSFLSATKFHNAGCYKHRNQYFSLFTPWTDR